MTMKIINLKTEPWQILLTSKNKNDVIGFIQSIFNVSLEGYINSYYGFNGQTPILGLPNNLNIPTITDNEFETFLNWNHNVTDLSVFWIKNDFSKEFVDWVKKGTIYFGYCKGYYGHSKNHIWSEHIVAQSFKGFEILGEDEYIISFQQYKIMKEMETKMEVKKEQKTNSISYKQFSKLYEMACHSWKTIFKEWFASKIFEEVHHDFVFTETQIEQMKRAATESQLKYLEELFPKKEMSFRDIKYYLSGRNFQVRSHGNFENKSFWLDTRFRWKLETDNQGVQVLIPSEKEK